MWDLRLAREHKKRASSPNGMVQKNRDVPEGHIRWEGGCIDLSGVSKKGNHKKIQHVQILRRRSEKANPSK